MSEISNYEAQKKKLQGLCDEHNFTFRFFKDRYPITLVINPINDVATQMDMLGNVEETGYCSQDSSMCWYFENSELKTKVEHRRNLVSPAASGGAVQGSRCFGFRCADRYGCGKSSGG